MRTNRATALDHARSAVDALSVDDLLKLRAEIDLLLPMREALASARASFAMPARVTNSAPHGWIETRFIERNGKTYGPYQYERFRDEQGIKRSRYLGKVVTGQNGSAN